ncbi:DinB family protein [Aldersonia kunmingensis]|uniref:DinB family protein n=1 Tax=Aldersonia kunmingensis TaxID=408066 RepID=UPI00082A9765|nr:DinB family protein [Aldersonia kunmingensis]
MSGPEMVDRTAIAREFERARTRFHQLLEEATDESLSRPSAGTRWTNEQLLFHMLFGYMVVEALVVMVRVIGRLPARFGRIFARMLDAATGPFNVVNFYGSCAAALVFNRRRMGAKLDRVIARLTRRLQLESETDLARGMYYPIHWDPFFTDYMTLADIYRYPTQHFDFHERQLTLDRPS